MGLGYVHKDNYTVSKLSIYKATVPQEEKKG